MTIFQYFKVIVKIVTILPVVVTGIKAIVKAYKDQNDLDVGDLLK